MKPADHPNYFRIFYAEAEPLLESFTQAQCQKLIGAMAMYFLFHIEPCDLPKSARVIFESHRPRLDRYRASAMNGKKSVGKKRDTHAEDALTDFLPAETQDLGTPLRT